MELCLSVSSTFLWDSGHTLFCADNNWFDSYRASLGHTPINVPHTLLDQMSYPLAYLMGHPTALYSSWDYTAPYSPYSSWDYTAPYSPI